jgi:KAP family P-loop domain
MGETMGTTATHFDAPPKGGSPFVGHILLDVPAADPAFGFKEIARALADIIQASEPRFAVGVFGSWGSGKSTLMDAIAARIDTTKAIVVPFNAWRYEREPHLILPLLDTIRGSLSSWADDPERSAEARERARDIAGRIGKVVRALARGFSAQIGLPGAVTLSFDTDKALDAMSNEPDDVVKVPQSLYFAAFQELTAAFREVEEAAFSRIVVFVDDLDRCLPTSALTILESMKLFFDMPGFVFVVGMDEQVIERAVSSKFIEGTPAGGATTPDITLDREYLKKIFQVNYTLSAMAPGDLVDLLKIMERQGGMADSQRDDLRDRVRRYLPYVAPEGRVNPRDVKRFVNAYTLQRMIHPELHADTVLALQTLEFRRDWEEVYDILLAEPADFVGALRRYRGERDTHAFENLWPQLAVLPVDLVDYLRSDEAGPLTVKEGLEPYVSSLKSARSTQTWLHDAIRDVGHLRKAVREIPASIEFGSPEAKEAAERIQAILSRLERYEDPAEPNSRLRPQVERFSRLLNELAPPLGISAPSAMAEGQVEAWKGKAQQCIDVLHQELRLMRRASAFAAP